MLTSTSPGASYQCPAMIPYPVQAASPPNAWALTVPAMPGTLTPFPYSATSCARARLGAQRGRHRRVLRRAWAAGPARRPGRTARPAPGSWRSGSGWPRPGSARSSARTRRSPRWPRTRSRPASPRSARAGRTAPPARGGRPRQAQPGGEPVGGVPATRPRGAAGRDRLRGGQPARAQRRPEPGQQHQREHPGRGDNRSPPRHLLAAHAVCASRLAAAPAPRAGCPPPPRPGTRPAPAIPPGSGTRPRPGPGVNPMLFSTPIRAYPATTAPLTTLPTMSTAMARPISANATTNGSMIAPLPVAWFSAAEPGGRAGHRARRQRPAHLGHVRANLPVAGRVGEPVQHLRALLSRRAPAAGPISPGVTQPSAVLVTELPKPTTVSGRGPRHAGDGEGAAEPGAPAAWRCRPAPPGRGRPASARRSAPCRRPGRRSSRARPA